MREATVKKKFLENQQTDTNIQNNLPKLKLYFNIETYTFNKYQKAENNIYF